MLASFCGKSCYNRDMFLLIVLLILFLVGVLLCSLSFLMKKQPGWQIVSLILGGLLTASPFLLAAYLLWLMKTI
ncbi:Hypothetical protein SSA_0745 [Streptococcus sanguinis SK36]|uniref:Transmembrane protein n=10 Tax=Streptococcus sanguinis TaxID=1305 RepID=A3CLX3_STRSV|nr:Hypothetical protein SSA_0745 [Streptococcus sanguinis SK36]